MLRASLHHKRELIAGPLEQPCAPVLELVGRRVLPRREESDLIAIAQILEVVE